MKDNRIELADVVRQFKDNYIAQFGHLMMPSHKKALTDIAACMTAEMGGHQYQCRDCGQSFWVYHGCRNRACPACHGRRMRDWLASRKAELLPCDYYHVVATVPEEMRHLFLSDQKFMYSLFMKTVAGAVSDLTRDRKYLGATPGILMVLHTWTSQLHYHPHVHLLVTGGGVSDDGHSWREPPGAFLMP
ncbi:MAG: transposase zinc-binding domain-containing protein, partial [Planctomycetes bacterium]|nr:transposase zinc-binding domain-containing protein [Planctomycetota bacterium]